MCYLKFQNIYRNTKFLSIQMKYLQNLATKISKVKNDLSPETMKEFLSFKKMKIMILGVIQI